MQTINKQTLTLDLVTNTTATLPKFTQYDTNILEFTIKESGVNADLSNVSRIAVNVKRPDGIIISRLLTNTDNVVTYEFGQEEQQIIGIAELIIQFFDNNDDRISTKRVEVKFTESFEPTLEQPEQLQLLETLFAEVDTVLLNMNNAEAIRVSNESTRQAQEATRQTNTTTAINELNAVKNANIRIPKNPVANFAAIATTYPTPSHGWRVQTTDNGRIYIYDGPSATWVFAEEMNSNILTDIQTQISDTNRQSTTLSHGVSIVNAPVDGPVDFTIEGRTLTSLGNSNLNGDKYHVLSGKNYKVKVDNTVYTGVTKFQKKSVLTSKADFVGKVQDSTVDNPHLFKGASSSVLQNPISGSFGYAVQSIIDNVKTLNGVTTSYGQTSANGFYAQQIFSFDLISHIERNMGRIPKTTVADKVQWIKDNVQTLMCGWSGTGSSVGGNKATLAVWRGNTLLWAYSPTSHTNSAITKLTRAYATEINSADSVVDANGFIHFLAYAEPSDGVTASSISTDFVELQVDLKSTAVLDTRPIVIRVEDFANKVSGSTVENPHKAYGNGISSALQTPTGTWAENTQGQYDPLRVLDGTLRQTATALTSGLIAQQLYSFDIIQAIERNVGRIPKATLAEKVQWVKDNAAKLTCDWHGFGSSVGGNKATVQAWGAGAWYSWGTTSQSTVTKVGVPITTGVSSYIDSNGMFNLLAHADASDGVVASTINTDFISCEIELKPEAILHDPSVPLYEVDGTTEYPNILVTWDENTVLSRYPRVQGSKPLDGLAVIAEGENIHPTFNEVALNSNAISKAPYELELNAPSTTVQPTDVLMKVLPNTTYTFSVQNNLNNARIAIRKSDGSKDYRASADYVSGTPISFTTDSATNEIYVRYSNASIAGTFTWKNPMLNVGSTAKPFVPRNPSYLFAPVKLGQIGDKKDSLFRQDGVTYLRKEIERVDLDGSLAWLVTGDLTGSKGVRVPLNGIIANSLEGTLLKYNGSKLKFFSDGSWQVNSDGARYFTDGYLYVSISDIDTGFGETYTALADEIKAYFNGWQAKTVDANGKPTAWRSLGDGTDAPTQTLDYVKANKAPNFTPYKLSYVRATASQENVSHLVEGDLVVGGATQVEVTSGVIVREKANVVKHTDNVYYINNVFVSGSNLKNKPSRLLGVYKGSNKDSDFSYATSSTSSYGNVFHLKATTIDSTQDYYVSYLVLDRHLFTVNALAVKATYAGNIRGALDDVVTRQSDLASRMSVHDFYLYKLLLGAKNAGWNI